MQYFVNLFRKHWVAITILIVPIPSIFWIPFGHSLIHGASYPWPNNFSSFFGIATQFLYSWISGGLGFSNTEPSGFLSFFLASLFLKIGGTVHSGQVLFFYFGFVGVIGGMYFLARTLKFCKPAAIATGVFYLFSPAIFTGAPLEIINFKLIPYHIITPVLLAFFIKTLREASFKKNLALFGIICYLATAGYSSLQYLFLHLLILSIYSIFFIFSKFINKEALKNSLFRIASILALMLLINYFWLSPLLSDLKNSYNLRAEPGFSINHDSELIKGTSAKIVDALRMMPYPLQADSSPWMAYYYSPVATIAIFGFLFFAIWSFINKRTRRFAVFPGIWLVISVFFAKGIEIPFTSFSEALFSIHPYFTRLFRNVTYFELLIMPALALLVGLSIGYLIEKRGSGSFRALIFTLVLVMFTSLGWPFITGKMFDSEDNSVPSQTNITPGYFRETIDFLKNKRSQGRINSIPQFTSQDEFTAYKWDSVYLGVPPLGVLSGKAFYRPLYPMLVGKIDQTMDSVIHPQLDSISHQSWNILSEIANVNYIFFHRDIAWNTLYASYPNKTSNYNEKNIENFIYSNKKLKKIETLGKIDIYRFTDDAYLPQIYTPQKSLILKRNLKELLRVTPEDNWQIRSAVFFENQNVGKDAELSSLKSSSFQENDLPTLEFKKINPTKYRIRVHAAKGEFPLIFSESFHEGWKSYLVKPGNKEWIPDQVRNDNLNNYKILDGNADDQATKDELRDYLQKGYVTTLGNGEERTINHEKWNADKQKEEADYTEKYNVDFVSKDFQGTIQNDNLPSGHFWETWFQKPIENNDNHLMANGYANSWVIDPEKVCGLDSRLRGNDTPYCVKNADGSYDFEIVVEFWPQRLFYAGLGISGLTLLGCLIYLGYDWGKNRDKIETTKNEN